MLDQTSQWYKLQYPECFSNEEQRSVQKLFADFVERNIMPVRHKIDDDLTHDEIITPILKKFQVDLGCQADMIPEDCGGNEFLRLGMVAAALKSEQLSCGDWGINLHTSSPPLNPASTSATVSGRIKIGPLMWFSRLRKAISCKLLCPGESPRERKDG
jgi:alkylation response protein AidB-like acyl-CoA dehydrogenase